MYQSCLRVRRSGETPRFIAKQQRSKFPRSISEGDQMSLFGSWVAICTTNSAMFDEHGGGSMSSIPYV